MNEINDIYHKSIMITFKQGENIFRQPKQAIVNPVNSIGVMGAGLALEFKKMYPDNYQEYLKKCREGLVKPGKVFITERQKGGFPEYIINFPTKQHFREQSRYIYIDNGMSDLVEKVQELNIQSIAIPALGCGLGGLQWDKVKEILLKHLSPINHIDIVIHKPR